MNKRPAQWQGGDERYGAFGGQTQQEDMSDVPKQATAAQLAKRKIAQLKRRPRSESPLTNTGSIFEQANQNGLMNGNTAQPAANPFGGSSSFQFGGNQQTTNGASTPSFGSGGGTSFNFGGNNTQNSNQTGNAGFTFGSSSTTPNSSFVFGQQQPQNSQSAQTNGTTPKASFSFGQQPAQQNGGSSTSFNFGQNDATPKPATTNIFGNSFTGGQTSSTQPPNSFGAASESSKPSTPFGNEQPKSTGGFNFGNTSTEQPAPKSTSGFTFGGNTTQQSDKTPQSQSNLFSGFNQPKPSEPQTATPATNGWAAFTQSKPAEAAAPVTNGTNSTSAPSTSLFTSSTQPSAASTGSGSSIFSGLNQQSAKTPTFKFTSQNDTPAADNDYSMMSPENTPQKPSAARPSAARSNGSDASKQASGAESATPAATPKPAFDFGKGASLFDRISKDTSSTPAAPPSQTPQTSESLFKPSTSLFSPAQTSTSSSNSAPPKAVSFAPTTSTAATSASTLQKETSMSSTKSEHYADIRELNESLLQHLQSQDSSRDWSTIFQYYQTEVSKIQQPQAASKSQPASKPTFSFGNSVLGKPTSSQSTSSASPPKQASTIQQPQQSSSSTSQPSQQPLYPQLPSNASNTAKLFQATLDKSTSQPSTSLFSPAAGTTKTDAAPDTGGFRPTGVSSAGSSFLSSFGQKASETANKEKKKRRDEDFDSDEDNEADWEKKDAEEQEARKAKLEEAARSAKGFVFTPAGTSGSTSAFSGFGQPTKPAAEKPTSTLFNFNPSGNTSTPSETPETGLFGAPSTPAATTNGASNLFANAAKSSTPAPLFSLQQPASTPAILSPQPAQESTTAEGEEGDAAPPEPQAEDMAILLPSETSENEVLFHVEKSKSRKFEPRASEGGTEKLTWVDKGLGPLWILRNKSTGKSRILQKIKDSGRAAMNFSVLAGDESMYKHEGMNGKAVVATFVDHISSNGGKPTRWLIMVGKPDDAKEITKILREEQKNA